MSEWVKMRATLPANPKVARMARWLLETPVFCEWLFPGSDPDNSRAIASARERSDALARISRAIVVTGLLRLWGTANGSIRPDNVLYSVQLVDLDAMAGDVPYFGAAMAQVGWAVERDAGVELPNFEQYNTPSSTRNETGNAARSRAWRAKQRGGKPPGEVLDNEEAESERSRALASERTSAQNRTEKIELISDLTEATDQKTKAVDPLQRALEEAHKLAARLKLPAEYDDTKPLVQVGYLLAQGHAIGPAINDAIAAVVTAKSPPGKPVAYFLTTLRNTLGDRWRRMLSGAPRQRDLPKLPRMQ